MNPSELYKLWAPEDSVWSNWAKPVLFADKTFADGEPAQMEQPPPPDVIWAPAPDGGTAIVLDLPGADAVWFGLALARRGYRPVPLYNGVCGPTLGPYPLVNVDAIVHALRAVGEPLGNLQLPANAPPVFLLDAERFAGGSFAEPGRFDNRWWVFPQDFPSMNFLQSRGIRSIILGQRNAAGPQEDLAHVLLRWQQGGIQILVVGTNGQSPPIPQQVEKPGGFRALWYRALVLAGLRRNSTGGFGAVIPVPGSGGGLG